MPHMVMKPAAIVLALLLAGCAVQPPPPPASVQTEAMAAAGAVPPSWSNPADAAAVSTGWVASFHDSTLSALVTEALANNNDLKIAAARVEQAQQALVIAGSPLFPSVGLDAGGHRTFDGSTDAVHDNSGASLTAVWELDVWGKIRSGQAGVFAQYEAVAQTEAFARLSIAGLVARGWYTSVGLRQNIALAQTQVGNYATQLDLVNRKNAAGAVDMMDVDQAAAVLSAARANLTELEARYDTAIRSLEVLLGRYPAKELSARSSFPALPGRVPAGTPAALVNRRPDVMASLMEVDAAFYSLRVAQLSLLPSFNLLGRGGRLNDPLLAVLGLSPDYLQFGAGLLQPVFEGGALNAGIAAATAGQREAVASYGQAMLSAFREVETALANESYFRQRLGNLQDEADSMTRAVKLAQDKFTAGEINMQNLLQLEERLEAAQQQVIEATTGILINRVDLYLALGGGL